MKVIRKLVVALAALVMVTSMVAVPTVGATDADQGPNFTTHMYGRHEVPAVGGAGVGWSTWQVEGDEMHYRIVVSRFEGDLLAIHLHQAPSDRNGPVVVPIDTSSHSHLNGGSALVFEGVITPDDFMADLEGRGMAALVGAVEVGAIYVNVHTSMTPSGALRGQLG